MTCCIIDRTEIDFFETSNKTRRGCSYQPRLHDSIQRSGFLGVQACCVHGREACWILITGAGMAGIQPQ